MEDHAIVALYLARQEAAIRATHYKYGGLCRRVADNILSSREDAEECVNDTWLALWNAIPPEQPRRLGAFAAQVTRNLALKRYGYITAEKRNPQSVCSLEELGECVSGREGVEAAAETHRVTRAIESFLRQQDRDKRRVFLLRYWYFEPIDGICRRTGWSRSKVTSMLFQLRQKLKTYLEQEGFEL